ncbi:hypothetical protein OESDEN_08013 [Oesophagostomum dentatum]|uniref:C6 domain-containing protein n=1 Tax=Oesophagostomum dentatum TaxID=61180 RepID=A0A0B1T8J2_OESDE|nr:hypothetical protein OESDEN_08013 [Oesophagostomum dentatum]
MRLLALLSAFLSTLQTALTCAATSPGTSIPRTTTTVSPGVRTTTTTADPPVTRTTTAATTTTTVALTACQTCKASQVSFDMANGDPGRIDSSFRMETNDPATGCLRLTAICTAQAGFFAFMEFNVVEGGPAENQDMGQQRQLAYEINSM